MASDNYLFLILKTIKTHTNRNLVKLQNTYVRFNFYGCREDINMREIFQLVW